MSIRIRPVTEADLDAIFSWWTNSEVMGAVRATRLRVTMEQLRNLYLPRWQNPGDTGFHQFIIDLDGKPIGEVGYQMLDASLRTARISVKVGDPKLWGQGLGPKAVQLMCDLLFTEKNVDSVVAEVGDWNVRSQRMVQRLGFTETHRTPFEATEINDSGIGINFRLERDRWVEESDRHRSDSAL